jgi:hypothetical protein
LASQDSQKIEERPMERAKVKNLCADAGNLIPSYLDVKNPSLAQTDLLVGIDLGVSMENINENVEVAKDLEMASLNLFLRNSLSDNRDNQNMDPPPIGDAGFLNDSDFSNSDNDAEDDLVDRCLEKFQNSLSARKMKHKGSPDNVCVKPKVQVSMKKNKKR